MSLARNVATVGTATLLSRLLGFLRDVGIAGLLGAGTLSDAFFAAFQIPNLFRRLLAEGALNSAFVPMWLRIRDERGAPQARRFGEAVLGTLLVVLAALALACIVFAPTVVHLLAPGFLLGDERFAHAVLDVRLSVFYIVVTGVVAVASSTLNAQGRVAAAAFGVVMFNLVMIAAVVAVLVSGTGVSPQTGAVLSAAVVLAGLGQLVLVVGALLRLPEPPLVPRLRLSAEVCRFYARMVPGLIAGGSPQLKLIVGAMVASSSPAAVSWLYYANRLYELPLGVVSVAISAVVVPLITASVRARAEKDFMAAQSRAYELALGLALPASVGLVLLAEPIVGTLFEHGAFGARDTAAVAGALAAIAAGLPGNVLEKVLAAVSFAHEDTRTPMLATLAGLAIAAAGAILLFPGHGTAGIAAAIALSGWIGAGLLAVALRRRRWLALDHDARRRLPRFVLATMVMGGAVGGSQYLTRAWLGAPGSTPARVAETAVLVAIGLAAYLAVLEGMNVVRTRDLVAGLRQRR